ncbi:MAG: ACT domain-containing protein [Candidatus Erginobacter occultus]|nr:ACT domain-containing protein [Candidatus Erginobacter occultus]
MRVKQISVFLENKAGRLWELTETLREKELNIRALSLADTSDFGILRMIVNRPEEAFDALKEKGFAAAVTEVLAVEVPDRPGGLAGVLKALNDDGVNVEYMYAFVEKKAGNAAVVIRVEEVERSVSVLAAAGVTILPADEVYNL